MKKVLIYSMALSVLSALILTGGCQSMSSKDDVVCPGCHKKVMTYHPQKRPTFKKVACPSCKDVVTVNDQNEITGTKHLCDSCDMLVAECPKCAGK